MNFSVTQFVDVYNLLNSRYNNGLHMYEIVCNYNIILDNINAIRRRIMQVEYD